MKIYFETETECDEFRTLQKCTVRKYFDKTTASYYLIFSNKVTWLGHIIKPELILLGQSQKIYSDYCNIVSEIERLSYSTILSQHEKEQLPKLLKSFNKFRDSTRNSYDTEK